MCERKQLQFPPRYFLVCKNDTAESVSASKTRSPSGRMFRLPCKDYFKGTCANSFCEKWHPPECLFYKTTSGCRFGEKCSYAHRQVDEQPSKSSKNNGDKSAVAISMSRTIERRNPLSTVTPVASQITDLLCATHRIHDNWVAYSKIWSRRSLHRFCGRAQTCRNRSDV